jgi:hypothetical protein
LLARIKIIIVDTRKKTNFIVAKDHSTPINNHMSAPQFVLYNPEKLDYKNTYSLPFKISPRLLNPGLNPSSLVYNTQT